MTEEKVKKIEELTTRLEGAMGVYLADFTGIDVGTVTELRDSFRAKGVAMKVAKNTMVKRAFDQLGIKGLDGALVGPTALIMSDNEDPIAPAKVIVDFHKKNENKFPVKSIYFDGQPYAGEQVKVLASMPGKRELQAMVVQIALGAGAQLVGLIQGPGSRLVSQIDALVERLESKA